MTHTENLLNNMQHQVPQFIDVEDKIFGPLTAKQFFYLLGGGAMIFIMYVFLQLWLVILLGIPIAALVASLAFLKINGQPFIKVLAAALNYSSSARLYLWRKTSTRPRGKTPDVFGDLTSDVEEGEAIISPIAAPPTGAFIGTPASIKAKEEAVTDPIDVDPLDDSVSETTRMVYGKISGGGITAISARSAKAPCPISRLPGPLIGFISPGANGGKL